MFVDSFLDIGGQRLTQGLAGAALALVATVAIAICIPVLLVRSCLVRLLRLRLWPQRRCRRDRQCP